MAQEELAMPAEQGARSPEFQERLWAPWWWWLLAAAVVAMLGPYVYLGFGPVVAVVTYAVLAAVTAAFLVRWAVRVTVAGETLRVAGTDVPLARVTDVRVLTRDDAREVLAGWPEPSALVLLRGYVRQVVYVATDGEETPAYLLVSSRRAAELAAAVGIDRFDQ